MCLFLTLATLSCSVEALAGPASAQVVAVIDGDTLLLKPQGATHDDARFYKLRLADIDAPELSQPYGEAAKRELMQLALHRTVRLTTVATDRYGRRVGWVSLIRPDEHDAADINTELVQRGAAWASGWHRRQAKLLPVQQAARRARRGLWADADALPPWVWRKRLAADDLSPASASTPVPSPHRY